MISDCAKWEGMLENLGLPQDSTEEDIVLAFGKLTERALNAERVEVDLFERARSAERRLDAYRQTLVMHGPVQPLAWERGGTVEMPHQETLDRILNRLATMEEFLNRLYQMPGPELTVELKEEARMAIGYPKPKAQKFKVLGDGEG